MKRCASNFHLKATQTTTSFYMVSISLSLSSIRNDRGGAGDWGYVAGSDEKRYKRKRKINEILLSCVRHCCRYFIIIIIAFILFKDFGYIVKSQSERSEDDGKFQKYAKSENRC